jgi:ParB-like chromosome segregation protein Spo0J
MTPEELARKLATALTDENGVVLVGHRQLAIAKELGIEPVIAVVPLGDGDEAAAKRLRRAIALNLGSNLMTSTDRNRIAALLYSSHGWVMPRIAQALGVTEKTISFDLRDSLTTETLG